VEKDGLDAENGQSVEKKYIEFILFFFFAKWWWLIYMII
jgi:hypothetical protein